MKNLSEINIAALAALISEKTGYHVSLFMEIRKRRNSEEEYINVESQELKHHTGIMSTIYESFKITNFGGGVTTSGGAYCLPVHFSFEYIKGGSNGTQLFTAWFDFATSTWTIQ